MSATKLFVDISLISSVLVVVVVVYCDGVRDGGGDGGIGGVL